MTSAFIASIYAMVAGSVIGTGALNRWLSLPLSVGIVSGALVGLALGGTVWHLRDRQ